MAGEWLKFEKSTLDKPEVLAVAAALGWDADMAVGKFVRMWCWFDTHTVNGDARGVTPALLDSILRVTGFVAEAQKVGWLEVHDGGIRLPKFDTHCGETAKKRALGAKRNADYRASNAKRDASGVTSASPIEEKIREEKKDQKQEQPAPSRKRSGASSPVAIDTWLESLNGDEAVVPEDPIFAYASKVNLPFDFIELAWKRFCEDMRSRAVRKKDWRAHFRNAVKGNWHRLWCPDGEGWKLTTVGEQARRALS